MQRQKSLLPLPYFSPHADVLDRGAKVPKSEKLFGYF